MAPSQNALVSLGGGPIAPGAWDWPGFCSGRGSGRSDRRGRSVPRPQFPCCSGTLSCSLNLLALPLLKHASPVGFTTNAAKDQPFCPGRQTASCTFPLMVSTMRVFNEMEDSRMEKRIAPSEQKAQALHALLEGQMEGQNGEELLSLSAAVHRARLARRGGTRTSGDLGPWALRSAGRAVRVSQRL